MQPDRKVVHQLTAIVPAAECSHDTAEPLSECKRSLFMVRYSPHKHDAGQTVSIHLNILS